MTGDGMPTRPDGAYTDKPDPRDDVRPPGPTLEDKLRDDYTPMEDTTDET